MVVAYQSPLEIVGLSDLERALGILENVNRMHELLHGSQGRARTYDQSVNSRSLYH